MRQTRSNLIRGIYMKAPLAVLLLLLSVLFVPTSAQTSHEQNDLRLTVTHFEQGLQQRDISRIQNLVSPDIVVFENGQRNKGWPDFRDHHLIPEFREPAPDMKTEFVRAEVAGDMAWAYTRSDIQLQRNGKVLHAELWSIYILRKTADGWKIHVLDWSLRKIGSQ